MAPLVKLLFAFVLAIQVQAHFELKWPSGISTDEANEGTAPCGGVDTNDFSKFQVRDFHVEGESIYIVNTHSAMNILYRATLDKSATTGFQNLVSGPIQVNGLNGNCNPQVPAPSSFVGQQGILQVISNAPDGILYQCAAVNFVNGAANPSGTNGCTNSTGVTMSYTSDRILQGLSGNSSGIASSNSGNPTSSADHHSSATGAITQLQSFTTWSLSIGIGLVVAMLV